MSRVRELLRTRCVLDEVRAYVKACDQVRRAELAGDAGDIVLAHRAQARALARIADFAEAAALDALETTTTT